MSPKYCQKKNNSSVTIIVCTNKYNEIILITAYNTLFKFIFISSWRVPPNKIVVYLLPFRSTNILLLRNYEY